MKRLRLRVTSAAPETQAGFVSLLLDATPRMRRQGASLTFSTNQHGYADLRATIPMSLKDQFRFYDRVGTPHIAVTDTDGAKVWSGRVEDVQLGENLLTLGGYGYWRAFADTQYTALWSDTRVGAWKVGKTTDDAQWDENRYLFDLNNRLFISPQKNATLGNTGTQKLGVLVYDIPHRSTRQITTVVFSFITALPANWSVGLAYYSLNATTLVHTYLGTAWTATGTTTGTPTATLGAAADRIVFYLSYGAADALNTAENGTIYLRIPSVRVKTTTSTNVTADLIAKDLVAAASTSNPYQLSSSTALIQSPGLDLQNILYEDRTPADILNELIRLGGNTSPPQTWECGVYDDQTLFYRPTGSAGRTWTVDIDDLQLNRSITTMTNMAYARYRDASGTTLRTATTFSTPSITRYQLTRQRPIAAQTTDATNALYIRNTELDDGDEPKPRASIAIRTVSTTNGKRVPAWTVRAGDTIRIRNLPPNVSSDIDRIRVMRLSRTNYDAMRDELSVEPEEALPLIDVLLAAKVNNG